MVSCSLGASVILLVACCARLGESTFRSWSADRSPERWNREAKQTLDALLDQGLNKNVAKNLILFLGDGMGVSTVTAGRIRKGQLLGSNGEETITYMESLPHLALSKTYNIDAQTPDSAGTGTAYLCGVKTSAGILGLNGRAIPHNCSSTFGNEIDSILKWAHRAGKSTGIVTTTRITHATPAAAYAHSAFRDWEAYDGKKFTIKQHERGCKDIAAQLIDDNSFINVVLGGGRIMFMPNTSFDYELEKVRGHRIDGRHLIDEWTRKMSAARKRFKFIYNASDFRSTNFKDYEHILGILSHDNLKYECERNSYLEPSIAEMTLKAIDLLKQNKNGFFLLVEGGRIDHGHHENKARKALDDFVIFDEAIGESLKVVNESDTMVVVTADHSHTFTIGGNSMRGNPIYGLALARNANVSDANLTFTSILYGNGPGGLKSIRTRNLTNEETHGVNYTQEAAVFKKSATHGAEDVAIYAYGPMSYLFSRTVEQNFITHAMAYSACIGPYANTECRRKRGVLSDTSRSLSGVNMSAVSSRGRIDDASSTSTATTLNATLATMLLFIFACLLQASFFIY